MDGIAHSANTVLAMRLIARDFIACGSSNIGGGMAESHYPAFATR
jgi:hypothetical protein